MSAAIKLSGVKSVIKSGKGWTLLLVHYVRNRWLIFGTLAAMLLVALGWTLPWAYRQAKAWRAQSLSTQALAAAQQQDWASARLYAQGAYLLAPFDAATLRNLAELQTGLDAKAALSFYKQLVKLPEANAADRRSYAAAALKAGNPALAWTLAKDLWQQVPTKAENVRLATQAAWAAGQQPAARAILGQRLLQVPEDRWSQLHLGMLLMQNNDLKGQALPRLEAAAEGNDALAMQALLAMGSLATTTEGKSKLAARLRQHPKRNPQAELLALELEAPPGTEEDRRAWVAARIMPQAGEREAWARVLLARGYPELALQLGEQSAAPVGGDQRSFLLRMDALAQLNRWNEIRAELQSPNLPLPESIREVFLARCALELGETTEADWHWSRAQLAAGTSQAELNYLAEYAFKGRLWGVAKQAYQGLLRDPRHAHQAYVRLIRLLELQGDTSGLVDLYRQMIRQFPADDAVANDYLYLRLLREEEVENALEEAQERVNRRPEVMAFRVTLALAYLRAGRPELGEALYQPVLGRMDDFQPGWQAVYVGLLKRLGKRAQAENWTYRIPLLRLKAEERLVMKAQLAETQ